jgi:hypothetical protein
VNIEIEYVQRLARNALIQLGEGAPDWRIAEIGYVQIGDVLTEDEPTNTIRASLESLSGSYSPVDVDFTVDAPFVDATLELATQVQDQAVEATHGASLPPCPGHNHPAAANLVNGVPKWVCLTEGADYYAADILPRFDPRYTLEEYMKDNPAYTSPG